MATVFPSEGFGSREAGRICTASVYQETIPVLRLDYRASVRAAHQE
jgi:hypothetical protein